MRVAADASSSVRDVAAHGGHFNDPVDPLVEQTLPLEKDELEMHCDIRMLMNHGVNLILGRSMYGNWRHPLSTHREHPNPTQP